MIRLRAPWDLDADSLARSRRFNRPTGLTARHRVELVAENLAQDKSASSATLMLNGRTLGRLLSGAPAFRCDITAWLEPRNLLTIRFDDRAANPPLDAASSPGAASSLGNSDAPADVRLEIHEPGRSDQDTSHHGANN